MSYDPHIGPSSSASVATEQATILAPGLGDWLELARPRQWVKNLFVLTPLLFSGRATEPQWVLKAIAAFAVFCVAASTVYAVNDVLDRIADQAHPTKRERPVASGRISAPQALTFAVILAVLAVISAAFVRPAFAMVIGAYFGLNVTYSAYLKRVVIVEAFVIASFFLLRLIGGSIAVSVTPSVWLLLCGGLLALYLGFAKRRHELVVMGEGSAAHRSVLQDYSTPFLDQISVVLLSVTVIAYIMYTLTSQTAAQTGTEVLTYSTVFVLYGVFRYLYLVHEKGRGSPTETLLTDRALLIDIALWMLFCAWVIYS